MNSRTWAASARDAEPRRWGERALPTERRSTIETAIGDCIRELPPPPAANEFWLGAIEQRLLRRRSGPRPTSNGRRFWLRAGAFPIVLLLLLLSGAAAAFAGRALLSWRRARHSNPRSTAALVVTPGKGLRSRPPATVQPLSDGEAVLDPAAAPSAEAARLAAPAPLPAPAAPALDRVRPAAVQPARHASPSRPHPSHLGAPAERPVAEGRLLGDGMRALRTDHDPRRALELLDECDRRYPRGVFSRQASMVRAEALLALGETSAALGVMDAVELENSVADRSLALARAELRATHARCPEAIEDFDRVLGLGGTDESAERALYGRALCRARSGKIAEARADLGACIERFPRGDKRPQAERALRALIR